MGGRRIICRKVRSCWIVRVIIVIIVLYAGFYLWDFLRFCFLYDRGGFYFKIERMGVLFMLEV